MNTIGRSSHKRTRSHVWRQMCDMARESFPREKAILKILRRHVDKRTMLLHSREHSSSSLFCQRFLIHRAGEIVFRPDEQQSEDDKVTKEKLRNCLLLQWRTRILGRGVSNLSRIVASSPFHRSIYDRKRKNKNRGRGQVSGYFDFHWHRPSRIPV